MCIRDRDVYVHRIVSYIGNYTYQMGGCDVITFTAGVGENLSLIHISTRPHVGRHGERNP